MNPVHTASVDNTEYKRTSKGKIDYEAYIGLNGTIDENGLTVNVEIVGARSRYGHLDLNVTPKSGEGTRWVEYKNLEILSHPVSTFLTDTSPVAETAQMVASNLYGNNYVR